jgi:hypothetical protein
MLIVYQHSGETLLKEWGLRKELVSNLNPDAGGRNPIFLIS